MVELSLIALVVGDWFFTNRENVIFALDCARNKWLRRSELR